MANWWKIGSIIGIGILIAACSFFIGRKTIEKQIKDPEVIYVPSDPIRDTIYEPKPYKIVEPIDTANIIKQCVADGKFYDLFPEKIKDSIIYVTREDTTAIMKDWATKRYYVNTLFDVDTLGSCKYNAMVQYNELTMLGYEYTPIQKQTEVVNERIRKFSPFIGVGLNTQPSVIGQAGIYFEEKYGVALQYNYEYKEKKNDFGLIVTYKF